MFKSFCLSLLLCLAIQPLQAKENRRLIIKPVNETMYVYTTFKKINGVAYSSNAMYILANDGAILLDTPWDPTQYQPLMDHIKKTHNKAIIALFVTHAHDDRAGGLAFFNEKGIPSYAYSATNKILAELQEATATNEIQDGQTFTFDQQKFSASFLGAGHTLDNIVFWFPKEEILYGACLIKSAESQNLGYTKDGNVKEWQKTMQKIKQRYPNATKVIPGHDEWDLENHIEHTEYLINEALK